MGDVVSFDGAQGGKKPSEMTIGQRYRAGLITKAQRRAKVMELLVAGMTCEQVAEQVGMSRQGVEHVRKVELERLAEDTSAFAAELRSIDLTRVEAAIRAIYPKVLRGDLQAIDRLDKLIGRRQALLGAAGQNASAAEEHIHFHIDRGDLKQLERVTFGDDVPGVIEGTVAPELPEIERANADG